MNLENDSDIPGDGRRLGRPHALMACLSWGPVRRAKVGLLNGEYVLNPDRRADEESVLDLVVAGTEDAS